MGRRTVLGATVVAAVLTLGACGGGGDDSSDAGSDSAGSAEAPAMDSGEEAAGDGAAERDDAGGVLSTAVQSLAERQIIYTIDLTISTDDVQAAAGRAATIATTAGGFVASEHVSGNDEATLTLEVPSEGHQDTVTELEALGKVVDRSRGTEDVTQEVVDTASRIDSQRASIARIRALLDQAAKLSDVVSIESELAGREADLDALLSRQEQLAGLTSMATVTLTLFASGEEPPEDDDDGGFLWGLSGGWDALVTVGGGALTVIGAVLPFAVLAAVVGVPAYLLVRRRRGQPTPEAPPA